MLQKEAKYLRVEVLTLFLLIVCTLTVEASPSGIKKAVANFLKNNKEGRIDANGRELKLTNKILDETDDAVVWKASFGGKEVAIKISTNADKINREIEAYQALGAFDDSNIKNHGIPRIYHTGQIFKKFSTIVMTLFDETLKIRLRAQNGHFNAYSTLQVFLQSVKALTYINSKRIIHNNINPENIFLRRNRVFIGGFDFSVREGQYSEFPTSGYASSRYWRNTMENEGDFQPLARDDLESLVYTIWTIENISRVGTPGGVMIASQSWDESVAFMRQKCQHFANFPLSLDACLFIFIDQIFCNRNPDYDQIISKLEAAIGEVKQETNQTDFEWINAPPRSSKPLEFGSA